MKHNKHTIESEIQRDEFRVAIFGSARIKPNDACYKMTYDLAKKCGEAGFDVVTGGGPGLMEAANAGHRAGAKGKDEYVHSIGLTIRLPKEQEENEHLDIKKNFEHFSSRLDHFMALSSFVVVMPGGVGTCLEFFYTWQLTQVKHIYPTPIILIGEMWEKLLDWLIQYPIKDKYIHEKDLENIFIAKDDKEAFRGIMKAYGVFQKKGKDYRFNSQKYRI